VLSVIPLAAQTPDTATLRGQVLDQTRAAVSGAEVKLINTLSPPRFPANAKYGYGFGDKNSGGDRVVGHNGGAPGMNAQLDIHWNTGYTVVVLSNFDPPAATEWAKYISDRLPLDGEKASVQTK
jgi:hypothetical protein